jgi:hypothetical protein
MLSHQSEICAAGREQAKNVVLQNFVKVHVTGLTSLC